MGYSSISMDQVKPGLMMWLPKDADRSDPETYRISGLECGATDHPVLIIGKIADKYLVFLLCSGKFHSDNEDLTVAGFWSDEYRPCECTEQLTKENTLYFLPKDQIQPKHTHVNIRKVYLGSLKSKGSSMLRQQFFVKKAVDAVLTPRSLDLVMTKVKPALRTFKERPQIQKLLDEHSLNTSWLTQAPLSTTLEVEENIEASEPNIAIFLSMMANSARATEKEAEEAAADGEFSIQAIARDVNEDTSDCADNKHDNEEVSDEEISEEEQPGSPIEVTDYYTTAWSSINTGD